MALGREIFSKAKTMLETRRVPVPKWGGDIIVRELTKREATDAQKFVFDAVDVKMQKVTSSDKLTQWGITLIRMAWIDEDGNQVLAPGEEKLLLDLGNREIERVAQVVAEISGLGNDEETTIADIEAAEKN